MSETYCGKSCADCSKKEELNCEGCRQGPGRLYQSDCDIVTCCKSKGHENCETCSFKDKPCSVLSNSSRMPEMRIQKRRDEAVRLQRKQEVEERRQRELAHKSSVAGKWLWILFWLFVPSVVANILSMDSMATAAPAVYMFGQILSAVCSVVYGIVLLQVVSLNDRYHTAGWCTIVGAVLYAFASIWNGANWTLVITIPASIVGLVGEYNEFTGHAEILMGVDQELSEKWVKLWKWDVGLLIATICCIVLVFISAVLGALVLLAATIGLGVVSIVKLVYLYRTAKVFREYIA